MKTIVNNLITILLLMSANGYADTSSNTSELNNSKFSSEVETVVSTQDAEGITQNEFNLEFLQALEKYTVEKIKINYENVIKAEGLPYKKMEVNAESVYTTFDDKKLAIIRLKTSFGSHQVVIMGVVENELRRVLCYRNDTQTISVTYGKCAEKIEETFQVKIAK